MRAADLFRLAWEALTQQKGRTLLALSGAVIGAFLLVVSLAVGQGIQQSVLDTFRFQGRLKRIDVYPGYDDAKDRIPEAELQVEGEMSDARRNRIRERLIRQWQSQHGARPKQPINEERLQKLVAMEHVVSATPQFSTFLTAVHADKVADVGVVGPPGDNTRMTPLIEFGDPCSDTGPPSLLIHEFLAYRWGFRSDDEVEQLIGQTIRLEIGHGLSQTLAQMTRYRGSEDAGLTPAEAEILQQTLEQLPKFLEAAPLPEEQKAVLLKVFQPPEPDLDEPEDDFTFSREYTVAGIFRDPDDDETSNDPLLHQLDWSEVVLSAEQMRSLTHEWPSFQEQGFDHVVLEVEDEQYVKPIVEQLREDGFQAHAMIEFIEQVRKHTAVVTYVMATLAAVALLVAALGISNVMAMSVLERTHEIGVMKAVGARDGQIQLLFLLEGAIVGFVGGGCGVLLGWLASYPGDEIARWVLAQRGFDEELAGSLFLYPTWITAGVPLFAGILTMLAAVYPARRATRIDPIAALRQE